MSTEREAQRLHDIVENIERIEGYVADLDFAGFAAKMMTVDAVRGLGNALRHDYDGVDLRVIWKTVRESLPALKADCSRVVGHPK